MPMLVGIVYGLTFQALALSKLGRHGEAMVAAEEALSLFDGTRPEGAENIFRWNAQVLVAGGKLDIGHAAEARAKAEVEAKAAKLRDPELRKHYLASRARSMS